MASGALPRSGERWERGAAGETARARAARGGEVGVPRVGFAGVGWIGRHRMEAIVEAGPVQVAAIVDPDPAATSAASALAPSAAIVDSFERLLDLELDGVVIATPSAAHAEQATAALERGAAVFCQKPLGRTAAETEAVVSAARTADRLLGVDLCYRRTAAMERVREAVVAGELGRVHAADLTFHNAYGPDRSWFYDPGLAGGGCLVDLGTHLVDLALWVLGFPSVDRISSRLYHRGRLVRPSDQVAEDHALVELGLDGGATVRIACSWNLHAGRDAVIEAAFYGDEGGAAMRNVAGSFYDFTADLYRGTSARRLADPPDAWGGRTIVGWAKSLARGHGFDPDIGQAIDVARVLDRVYERCAY